jgi:hypothetical protein
MENPMSNVETTSSANRESQAFSSTQPQDPLTVTYWNEVENLMHMRGPQGVTPFAHSVAQAVLDAALLALQDRVSGNAVHRTLAASTGSGKSSFSWCLVAALLKTVPDSSVLYVCPDVRQTEATYIELSKIIEEEDMAIWTGGHDAGSSLIQIKKAFGGFEPMTPRFWKGDLETRRVAIVSHHWYIEKKGVAPAMNYLGHPRTVHIIDERLSEVKLVDIDQGDVTKARDFMVAENGGDSPAAAALTALHDYMHTIWKTDRNGSGSYRAMSNSELEWFKSVDAETMQRQSMKECVSDALAFGRALVAGHAFLARYRDEKKGGRFLGYHLVLPILPGSLLLDASAPIDGVKHLNPAWRALVEPPKVTFQKLQIKHLPFPIVDPDGHKRNVKDIMGSGKLSTSYAEWIEKTIIAETEPGESILCVTHKDMILQGRLPEKLSFDDPWELEGGRKVALLWYGRGVGSNSYKQASTVMLCGLFWKPHRVSMAQTLGLQNQPASNVYLGEMANVNTRHKMVYAIKNGGLARWAHQLAMRGNARNFDDHGDCGNQKLIVVGEFEFWVETNQLLFPEAVFTQSEETKDEAKEAGGAQSLASYILAHPEGGFSSRDVCEATGIDRTNLTRDRQRPVVVAAMKTSGLVYTPGKGKAPSMFMKPVRIAAE